MSYAIGLTVESIVAVLLLLTIGYCVMLNRRLKQLRADEPLLKRTVAELVNATEAAERAVAGLKSTAREHERNLGEQLREAERLSVDLGRQIKSGEGVFEHLARVVAAARPEVAGALAAEEPPVSRFDPKAMVAAAQAIADRTKLRVNGKAA